MQDYLNIEKQYDDLISEIYKSGMHKIQYEELKKAFFAGAATIIDILIKSAHMNLTDDQGAAIFENLRQQVIKFIENMKKDNVNDNDINR